MRTGSRIGRWTATLIRALIGLCLLSTQIAQVSYACGPGLSSVALQGAMAMPCNDKDGEMPMPCCCRPVADTHSVVVDMRLDAPALILAPRYTLVSSQVVMPRPALSAAAIEAAAGPPYRTTARLRL